MAKRLPLLVAVGRRLTHRRAAVALAATQELDRAGRHLEAGPVLAVVPLPDARVLAARPFHGQPTARDRSRTLVPQARVVQVHCTAKPAPGQRLAKSMTTRADSNERQRQYWDTGAPPTFGWKKNRAPEASRARSGAH